MKMKIDDAYRLCEQVPPFYFKKCDGLVIFSYHYNYPEIYRDFPGSEEIRGIIFDNETGEIVARPFAKFFAFGSPLCLMSIKAIVSANEKIDGSLIIGFIYNDEIRLASRGSMKSWVVREAYSVIADNHRDLIKDLDKQRCTAIFEYVSEKKPGVLQYSRSDLYFIGARNIDTGELMIPSEIEKTGREYNVSFARIQFRDRSISEIEKHIRTAKNCEGVVIYDLMGNIAKIKSDWYRRAHDLSPNNITEKTIRQRFFSKTIDDVYDDLPETSKKKVDIVVSKINSQIREEIEEVQEFFSRIDLTTMTKKQFAKKVNGIRSELRGICFQVWNGSDIPTAVFEHLARVKFKEEEK